MALVSVVIAAYNRAEYLPAAIESVLSQTFRDFEVIVVDDGSTDGTSAAVKGFRDTVRYVYQENAERGAARNRGLRLAQGQYVAFLDSDDLWLPNKLEAEVRRLHAEPHLGLVYSDAFYINASGQPMGRITRRPHQGDVLQQLVCGNFVTASATLLDRAQFLAVGGFCEDRELAGSEDWEAWVRLAARVRFGYVANVGLLYRLHEEGTVAQPRSMERSMQYARGLVFADPALAHRIGHLRSPAYASMHCVLASLYYGAGDGAEARGQLRKARSYYPRVVCDPRYLRIAARLAAGDGLTAALRKTKRRLERSGADRLLRGMGRHA